MERDEAQDVRQSLIAEQDVAFVEALKIDSEKVEVCMFLLLIFSVI